MRPQQNRRMRGRGGGSGNGGNGGNPNRKGPNPLTRNYESNGPDVKIRGSAQQIAEKYTTLARDAQSAGDRVMAENYLQHAEHYNRIIMAAQAQMPQQQIRDARDDDELDDEGDDGFIQPAEPQPQPQSQPQPQPQPRQQAREPRAAQGTGPQPVIEGVPAEVALKHDIAAEAAPQPAAQEAAAPAPQQDEAEAPKRARRPRRPRLKAGEEAAEDAAAGSAEPVTEAAQ